MSSVIDGAVAVITDEEQRILITQRPWHTSHGGFWEFPGGKLEGEEQAFEALVREVKEELCVDVIGYTSLGKVRHVYPHQSVLLWVYHVFDYQGQPFCHEAQLDMRWVSLNEIASYSFPAANHEVIRLVRAHLQLANS